MRKLISIALLAAIAFLAGRFSQGPAARASNGGGAGGGPSGNGDVNCSGSVDISDAVYILSFLFLGGPGICPLPAGATGLPDTGQTKCYTGGGENGCFDFFPVSCPNSADGPVRTGCPNDASRFTVDSPASGEDTVTDNCTGLEWQRFPDQELFTWCEALLFCGGLTYGGHNDWRLPNVRELESIINYGRSFPAIDPIFHLPGGAGDGGGAGGTPNRFWSSTSSNRLPTAAWAIDFDLGTSEDNLGKTNRLLLRAVRGGQ